MKKIISVTYFIILMMAMPMTSWAQHADDEDLLGIISSADLQQAPFATWYNENDKAYDVDEASIARMEDLLDGVEIKIVMGTWCHDSRREVPRLYKILGAIKGHVATEMIGLDRKKMAPSGEIDGMEITNTPTFIFYKDGKELNRIVETPVVSLEKDMVNILSGQPYTNSKMLAAQ